MRELAKMTALPLLTSLLLVPVATGQNTPAAPPKTQAAAPSATCPALLTAPPVPASLAAAQQLYRTSKYDDALRAYTVVAEAGGMDAPAAYAGIGRTYLRLRKVTEALDAANRGIALTGGKGPASVALGEVNFRMGRIALAQEEFLASMKNCEFDARANFGMAEVALATSNRQYAKHQIDRARQLDPDDPDIASLWEDFLPPADQAKRLRERLAKVTDGDSRADMQNEVTMLEDEARDPSRTHSCRLVQPLTSTSAKLVEIPVGGYYVEGYALEVRINGVHARLQLDTGATGIAINHKLAAKAGIKPILHGEIGGIGDKGPASAFLGFADSVKMGDLEAQGCYVGVAEKRNISDVDGLIGGDFFSHYLVEIDLPGEKMNLTALPPVPGVADETAHLDASSLATSELHDRYVAPSMQNYVMVFNFDDHLLIPTRVNGSADQHLFLIDTGAFDNTISPTVAKQSTKVLKDYRTDLEGVNGMVKHVYRADTVDLAFSRYHQKHDDMVSFDMTPTSDSMGIEISGILGFNMLRMLDIRIDYRDGLVDFQYDPKRVRKNPE